MERQFSGDVLEGLGHTDEWGEDLSFKPATDRQPKRKPVLYHQREYLLGEWKRVFGCKAPKHISCQFMEMALLHEAQCKRDGWLSGSELRSLRAYLNTEDKTVFREKQFRCGDKLIREWNGKVYEVEVLASGFLFKDKKYRSLSGIAKLITGTNWSGPRFFGLRGKSS